MLSVRLSVYLRVHTHVYMYTSESILVDNNATYIHSCQYSIMHCDYVYGAQIVPTTNIRCVCVCVWCNSYWAFTYTYMPLDMSQ